MTKVLIVDDDVLILDGLKVILELEGFEVVGLARNAKEAYEMCQSHKPDVVLMDIRMPVEDGISGTKNIKADFPETKVIILTTFKDDEFIKGAISYGADGYILKSSSADHLVESIRAVLQDKFVLDREIASALPRFLNQDESKTCLEKFDLTEREKEIIKLVAEGFSNRDIAKALFLTEGTVRNYISILLEKLNLENRTQLAVFYYKSKIFE
ncbi:response regulator transcription factor [Caldicellulosiruptor morganii]|uniref:Response regulator transcription factor n=1 Tax=Caldicellulosiruptor morganii TaxID=1387555 RepID=A0ABY7BMX2_9FIRM|nr:response regulator transcription factor [Caldicellulosiruptor morganii]WAM34165.1 response regulator transcription factor [Caldicellulosiruptor morganii]